MITVDVSGSIRGLPKREIALFVGQSLRALRRRRAAPGSIEHVSIAFVDDATVRALNRTYRGKDKTTDILTFPGDMDDLEPGGPQSLGELVISVPQARRQAREERHALAMEVRYLILHGLIHALGYDHETDDGEMNALELRVRSDVGLD